MPFLTKNFNVDEGATLTFTIFWKDPNDVPINITGYTAKMQARDKARRKDTLLYFNPYRWNSYKWPTGKN